MVNEDIFREEPENIIALFPSGSKSIGWAVGKVKGYYAPYGTRRCWVIVCNHPFDQSWLGFKSSTFQVSVNDINNFDEANLQCRIIDDHSAKCRIYRYDVTGEPVMSDSLKIFIGSEKDVVIDSLKKELEFANMEIDRLMKMFIDKSGASRQREEILEDFKYQKKIRDTLPIPRAPGEDD